MLLLLDRVRPTLESDETSATAGCSSLDSAGVREEADVVATPESRCKSSSSSLPLMICFWGAQHEEMFKKEKENKKYATYEYLG